MSDVREALSAEQESDLAETDRAIREVFATQAGKRFMFWMLSECRVYGDGFMGDDAATNYTLGLQAAGKKLISKLESLDARYYPTLLMAMAEIREMDRAIARAAADNTGEDNDEAP